MYIEPCKSSAAAAAAVSGMTMGLVATGGNDGLVKIWSLPAMGSDILSPSSLSSEDGAEQATLDVQDGASDMGVGAASTRGGSVRPVLQRCPTLPRSFAVAYSIECCKRLLIWAGANGPAASAWQQKQGTCRDTVTGCWSRAHSCVRMGHAFVSVSGSMIYVSGISAE